MEIDLYILSWKERKIPKHLSKLKTETIDVAISNDYDSHDRCLMLAYDPTLKVFVVALLASLVVSGDACKFAYIESLDTSGYFQPRCHQKYLTQHIISSFMSLVAVKKWRAEKLCLLVHPKPSLLFPWSHRNPAKKPIKSSQDLLSFWMNRISQGLLSLMPQSKEKDLNTLCYYFVPGSAGPILFKPKQPHPHSHRHWSFGIPFNPKDKAYRVLPIIPDDVKAHHLIALQPNKDISVEEFFASIACKEDFRNDDAAFIYVELSRITKNSSSSSSSSPLNAECKPERNENVSENDNHSIVKIVDFLLNEVSFETLSEAQNSSKALMEMLQTASEKNVTLTKFKFSPVKKKSDDGQSDQENNPNTSNNIQSLVKRVKQK